MHNLLYLISIWEKWGMSWHREESPYGANDLGARSRVEEKNKEQRNQLRF